MNETLKKSKADILEQLKAELKKSAERMAEYKENGAYDLEAQEHAHYNNLVETINELEKDSESLDELKSELKKSAERMAEYRRNGAYDLEAQEHAYYNSLVEEIENLEKDEDEADKEQAKEEDKEIKENKDPVLEEYSNEGFGKNVDGWYFNPWIDEYDPDYDPHNDPEYNGELREQKESQDKDPVLEKYSNEGFGRNVDGWYFNPWVDEYDPDYDPHNDPEYNDDLKNRNNSNDNKSASENPSGKSSGESSSKTPDKSSNNNNASTPKTSNYKSALEEYKKMLDIYNEDLDQLYELQGMYEDGKIEYSEYEKFALYMADRYKFIMNEYSKVSNLYKMSKEMQDTIQDSKIDRFGCSDLSDEEIADRIEELEEERTEEWNYRAHQENGMEGHEDDKLDDIEEEIAALKQEQQDRKDRPYKNMSKEELEAELAKIEAEQDDLYHYGAHELNGLEDADGDKWAELNEKARQIKEELKLRNDKENNKDNEVEGEEPEKPDQPMMVDEKGKGDPQEQVALEKTGLQIFREQFNQMPEIKDKHTASERFNNIGSYIVSGGTTAIGGAIVAAAAIGLGPVGMAAVALGSSAIGILGSSVTAPLLRKFTGQSKLEKEIEEQFLSMDPNEFDKMVQYLGESKVVEMKPNAVILNALNRAMLKRTNDKSQEFKARLESMKQEREELIAKDTSSLSPEEAERVSTRLGELNAEIKDIEEKKIPKLETEALAIRRGKDAVSAKYKGNLKTKLNIFAKRNSTTEEYSQPLNEYADAELDRDTATVEGRHIDAALSDEKMKDVLRRYSTTDRLGRQNGAFNFRDDEGSVHLTSDKPENSAKIAGRLLTLLGAIGFTRGAQKWSQHQVDMQTDATNQNIDQANAERQDLQDTINNRYSPATGKRAGEGIVSDTHAQGEYSQIPNAQSFNDPNYIAGDGLTQVQTEDMSKLINGGQYSSIADAFDTLGKAKDLQATTTAQRLVSEVANSSHNVTGAGVDHALGYSYDANAVDQAKATSEIYNIAADVFRKIPSLTQIPRALSAKIMGGFLAPIVLTVREFMHERNESKQQANTEKVVDTRADGEDLDRD